LDTNKLRPNVAAVTAYAFFGNKAFDAELPRLLAKDNALLPNAIEALLAYCPDVYMALLVEALVLLAT
jgi:hypothetical protein